MIKAEVNQGHVELIAKGKRNDVLAECVALLRCLKEEVCDKSAVGDSGDLWVYLNKLALEVETDEQEEES